MYRQSKNLTFCFVREREREREERYPRIASFFLARGVFLLSVLAGLFYFVYWKTGSCLEACVCLGFFLLLQNHQQILYHYSPPPPTQQRKRNIHKNEKESFLFSMDKIKTGSKEGGKGRFAVMVFLQSFPTPSLFFSCLTGAVQKRYNSSR